MLVSQELRHRDWQVTRTSEYIRELAAAELSVRRARGGRRSGIGAGHKGHDGSEEDGVLGHFEVEDFERMGCV
jgi:hypothetical protein